LIFVTVGTHQEPFGRLLDGLSALGAERCVVQYGHGSPPPGAAHAVAFMPFDEIKRELETCERVVTHAGVGSILAARRAGHVPVVVPRLKRFNEHVDDHQAELTRALAASAKVIPVWDVTKLSETIALAPRRRTAAAPAGAPRLAEALRAAILAT
jgi:UDP-N-acetylglucosamine transferase subunit ALG13